MVCNIIDNSSSSSSSNNGANCGTDSGSMMDPGTSFTNVLESSSSSSSSSSSTTSSSSSASSVTEFYRGKSILLTGGTGFVGKVLLEKLLRTCPDLERVYLLMRSDTRDGTPPAGRLRKLLSSPAFSFGLHRRGSGKKCEKSDQNKSGNREIETEPWWHSKVIPIGGDMTAPGLGLSEPDRRTLAANVHVVIHSAATVRFHGPLRDFVRQNVLGTEEIMKLAREMSKLQAVAYVSTAYANCHLIDIDERIYPLDRPARTYIDEIMRLDRDRSPECGDPELLARPNSYTASKAIAENLVAEEYADLPVVICRPSIVTHAFREPIDGWCDSMNGLAGTLLLGGLGIARTMQMHCDYNADIIPVDFVANSLLVIAWHRATSTRSTGSTGSTGSTVSTGSARSVPVVHITSGDANPVTWGEILDYARLGAIRSPSMKLVRPLAQNPVSARGTLGYAQHFVSKLFSHFLFAAIFDLVLLCTGNRPLMLKVTRKMHRAFDVLEHFTNREWRFRYSEYNRIFARVPAVEREKFCSDVSAIDWIRYCDTLTLGSRRYLLHEDDCTIEQAKRRQRILTQIWRLLGYGWRLGAIAALAYGAKVASGF